MKSLLAYTASAALFLLAGCAHQPLDVSHQGDKRFDAALRTYAVVDHPVGSTPTTRHTFNTRIHPVMSQKGYERVPQQQADLYVSFKTLLMSDDRNEALNITAGQGPFTQAMVLGQEGPAQDVSKVVMVMIEEAKTDRVIWVGWSSGEVDRDRVVMSTAGSLDEILGRIPSRI